MNKKTYKEFLETDVYKGEKRIFMKLFAKYFNPVTNAAFLFRKMQYMNSQKGIIAKIQTVLLRKELAEKYGILASPEAIIGKYLRFVHPTSIVIGRHVVAGEHLSLYQNTTLGGAHLGDVNKGNQPVVGNNVTLFANSLALGNITIGDDVIIGANSLLLKSVPSGVVCVGTPARYIKKIESNKEG